MDHSVKTSDMILTGKCMQNSCQNYSTKTSGQSFLSKSCSSLFACLGRSIFFFFPRETFKVCWIKIYLAPATAFLRCHYFCCPSHFSYFLAFCSLYFTQNNNIQLQSFPSAKLIFNDSIQVNIYLNSLKWNPSNQNNATILTNAL